MVRREIRLFDGNYLVLWKLFGSNMIGNQKYVNVSLDFRIAGLSSLRESLYSKYVFEHPILTRLKLMKPWEERIEKAYQKALKKSDQFELEYPRLMGLKQEE